MQEGFKPVSLQEAAEMMSKLEQTTGKVNETFSPTAPEAPTFPPNDESPASNPDMHQLTTKEGEERLAA